MKKLITLVVMVFLIAGMAVGKTFKTGKAHRLKSKKLKVESSDVGVPFFIGSDTFVIRDAYLSEKNQRIEWVENKQRYSFWHNGDTLPFMTNQKWIMSVGCDNSRKANKLFVTTEETFKDTIVRKQYCYNRNGKKFAWNKKPPKVYKVVLNTKKPPARQNKKQYTASTGRI